MKIKTILKAIAYITKIGLYMMSLPFFGFWFYRKNCGINLQFCYNMCSHNIFRILYMQIFGCGILVFETLYIGLTNDKVATIMAVTFSALFLCERVAHQLFSSLKENNWLLLALMLVTLATMFTSHMLPLAVSLYLLLVAAVFYPSRRALEEFQSYNAIKYYHEHPAFLLDIYYS